MGGRFGALGASWSQKIRANIESKRLLVDAVPLIRMTSYLASIIYARTAFVALFLSRVEEICLIQE
jgi:hypothetical protein